MDEEARRRGSDSVVEEYLERCLLEEGLAPSSVRTYRQVLDDLVAWVERRTGQGFDAAALTRPLVREWQRQLATERALGDATYLKYVSALRSFLAWLRDEGRTGLGREDARLPKTHVDLSRVKALAPEEIGALLRAPDPATPWGRRDRALLALLYSSGMRVGELCGLDRAQIPLARLGAEAVLELAIVGKGRKPRVVYADAIAQRLLGAYLAARTDELPALWIAYRGPEGHGRLTPRAVQGALRRYARAAGLPSSPTPHTLRHTFAVHRLQAGADTRLVQAFLGHASLATTQRYTRVTDRYLREAYERSQTPAPDLGGE